MPHLPNLGQASDLGLVFRPGPTFSLDGDEHRARRKILVPPFHGKRMKTYEEIIGQEAISKWP